MVVLRGETGTRAPEVCSLFTVSLVVLSVADVLALDIGDFVKVDEGRSADGRGFKVDVVVVVVVLVDVTLPKFSEMKFSKLRTYKQTNKPFWSFNTCSGRRFCS